jgi:hypothetical protein
MPVFAKAVEHQVYPNSFKLAGDACVVQGAMLLDEQQRIFHARQIFRPAAPASNPDSVKVPTNGHRQINSVDDAKASLRWSVVFLAHRMQSEPATIRRGHAMKPLALGFEPDQAFHGRLLE